MTTKCWKFRKFCFNLNTGTRQTGARMRRTTIKKLFNRLLCFSSSTRSLRFIEKRYLLLTLSFSLKVFATKPCDCKAKRQTREKGHLEEKRGTNRCSGSLPGNTMAVRSRKFTQVIINVLQRWNCELDVEMNRNIWWATQWLLQIIRIIVFTKQWL